MKKLKKFFDDEMEYSVNSGPYEDLTKFFRKRSLFLYF